MRLAQGRGGAHQAADHPLRRQARRLRPQYRGKYGIEATRQALFFEARRGIHPFCISIDEEGPDYLPHMHGAANYRVVANVARLPMKVSEIYRKLTS